VYAEECWSVREAWVEAEDRAPVRMRADGDRFVASLALPHGMARYRFRVVLREKCRPDTAPFTRLGWDAGAANATGLATWELQIAVADPAVCAGEALHDKDKLVPQAANGGDAAALPDKPEPGAAEGASSVAPGVRVRDAALRIERSHHSSADVRVPPPKGDSVSDAGGGKAAASDNAAEASVVAQGNPKEKRRRSRLWLVGALPVVGVAFAALAAFAQTALGQRGSNDAEKDEVEERWVDRADVTAVVRSGSPPSGESYFQHAQTQGN
jgi:hypothetical protein